MNRAQAAAATARPYFFVLGVPKSGTTWVQVALDAHPRLLCRGEGKFLVFRDELSKAASAYSRGLAAMHEQVFGEEFFPPISRAEFDEMFRSFMELRLRSGGVAQGVERIGNKDPEHGMAIGEMRRQFPDAAYIQVIRDPRDLAVSAWRHMQRIDPATAARIGSFQTYAPMAVAKWAEYIQVVRKAAQTGLDYAEVRYEDLHADGEASLKRLYDFLGVETSPQEVAAALRQASFERSSGGRARGQEDPVSFYRKGVVGDWRGHMSQEEADRLLESTGGLAAELGYR